MNNTRPAKLLGITDLSHHHGQTFLTMLARRIRVYIEFDIEMPLRRHSQTGTATIVKRDDPVNFFRP